MPFFKALAPFFSSKREEPQKDTITIPSSFPKLNNLPSHKTILPSEITTDPIMKLLSFSKEKTWFVGGSYALTKFLSNSDHKHTWKPNDVDIFLPVKVGENQLETFDEKVKIMLKGWKEGSDVKLVSKFKFETSPDGEIGKTIVNRDTGNYPDQIRIYWFYGWTHFPVFKEENNPLVAITNYELMGSELQEETSDHNESKGQKVIFPTRNIQFVGISTENGTREEGLSEFQKWSDSPANITMWTEEESVEYKDQFGYNHRMQVFREKFNVAYETMRGFVNGWFEGDKIEEGRRKKYEERGFVFKKVENQFKKEDL
jgi:hypothetical protein